MRVLATRGDQELVDLGNGRGFIRDDDVEYPVTSIASLLARGYWDPVVPVTAALEFGDVDGHPFHGNQWTGGKSGGETENVNPLVDPNFDPREYANPPRKDSGTSPPLELHPGPIKDSMRTLPASAIDQLSQVQKGGAVGIGGKYGRLNLTKMLDERGAWYDARTAKEGPGAPNMCHWNAALLHAKDPDRYTWVYGAALAYQIPDTDHGARYSEARGEWVGPVTGLWIEHSWVEDSHTGRIIETNGLDEQGNGMIAYYGVALTNEEAQTMGHQLALPDNLPDVSLRDRLGDKRAADYVRRFEEAYG